MSPRRSRRCIRTIAASVDAPALPMSPQVNTKCGVGSTVLWYAKSVNEPSGVSIGVPHAGSSRRTSVSRSSRYSITCSTEQSSNP
ncbi:MAG: hypothetical protein DWI11_03335 [Planctomycetota bacterium]|nr:MAG: hypothetical protein DWI11_03335 [Planctomycetota bacterium]